MSDIESILDDRGSRYGDFATQAEVSQAIRNALHNTPNWDTLPDYMKEGLDMCVSKLSRILVGDHTYLDNVVDILGYMTLVRTEMEKEHARIQKITADALERNRRLAEAAMQGRYNYTPGYAYQADDAEHISPLNWAGPYGHTKSGKG